MSRRQGSVRPATPPTSPTATASGTPEAPGAPGAPKARVNWETIRGVIPILVCVCAWYLAYTHSAYYVDANMDAMLLKVVTAPYNATIMHNGTYITRHQHATLKKALYKNIHHTNRIFLLMGESGSGKTTQMQHLLNEEYKDGVISVDLRACDLRVAHDQKNMPSFLREAVLDKFGDSWHLLRRKFHFEGFIKHANQVRKQALGEQAHPLIIYLTLDSENMNFDYEIMNLFASTIGQIAGALVRERSCKIILEFSKTAISDEIIVRSDVTPFEVDAMTQDEFIAIGKQVLGIWDAPDGIVDEYLKHYHDWLGGQTKMLRQTLPYVEAVSMHSLCCLCTSIINHTLTTVEKATADTKNETLGELKSRMLSFITNKKKCRKGALTYKTPPTDIDMMFSSSVEFVSRGTLWELMERIAATGTKGFHPNSQGDHDRVSGLMKRDSESTLVRRQSPTRIRIHDYSHALYLHNVMSPFSNAKDKIKEVKEKFGLHAKSSSA